MMAERKAGVRRIFHDFTLWTSSHGIPHIGQARHKAMIVFWALITLAATGLLIWQVVMLVIRFLKYDVTVGMELKFERRAFPAVTVCDLNPYKRTNVASLVDVQDLLNSYEHALYKASCGGSCRQDTNAQKKRLKTYGFEGLNDTVALQSKARDLLVLIMAKYSERTRIQLSNRRNELIKSCSFNTKDCNIDDFKAIWDAKMGNCFTFNHDKNPKFFTSRAGPLYGLRLIFLTNTSEYIRLTEAAGVRVIIHNQTVHPFPDTFGYNVEIGSSTSMGVSFKQIRRLGSPYGSCINYQPPDYLYGGQYTSEGCQRSCFQRAINAKCGCFDPNYPAFNSSTTRRCSIENDNDRQCWFNLTSSTTQEESKMICKECQLPCEEGVYDVTVSAATWPARSALAIADCSEKPNQTTTCWEIYKNNGAMVEVFYEQLNYQLLEESPAYEFVNLASDFGGQIGLWLGLSALSIIEFFVLFSQVCAYGVHAKPPPSASAVRPHRASQAPTPPQMPLTK